MAAHSGQGVEVGVARPGLFIGSSREALDVAYSLQAGLEFETDPTVWTQGVFRPTSQTLTDLMAEAAETDFAAFIFAPDDIAEVRGERTNVVRDNVLFELGLFIGALGAERCFIVTPRGSLPLKLPSDLLGVSTLSYAADRGDGRLHAALGPASHDILQVVRRLGSLPRESLTAAPAAPQPKLDTSELTDRFIQEWEGPRLRGPRDRLRAGAPMHMIEDEEGQATRDVRAVFDFLNSMADALLEGRVDEKRARDVFEAPVRSVWAHAFHYLAPLNMQSEWWDPAPKIAELDLRWRREGL